jgi:O-acetylserine/cysteine efflux transporter
MMPIRDIGLALFVAVLWGVNFVVMKHAATELPPLALTGLRFALAAIPAVFLIRRPAVSWRILIVFGLAFGVIKFGLLFTAFRLGMPAGLASLVLQMQVVFTIAFAAFWFGERPRPQQWAGIGVALGGMGLIVSTVSTGATLLPVLLTLAAAVAWASANMAVKHAGRVDMLGFAAWTCLIPAIVMPVLSLLIEGPAVVGAALQAMSWLGIAAVAYLAWPITLLSGAMFGWLMTRHPAATVAPFILLVPVIGMLAGRIVYGETLTPTAMAGAGLIVAGLVLTVLGAPRAAALVAKPTPTTTA